MFKNFTLKVKKIKIKKINIDIYYLIIRILVGD